MPLILDIKPGDSIIIGKGTITNKGTHKASLAIEGDIPVLHQKELMRESEADTPCKRLYITLQTMYLSGDATQLKDAYAAQVRDIQQAQPGTALHCKKINDEIEAGRHHKALKEARRLIEHEAKPLSGVGQGNSAR